jgi:hypothetical protein
MSEQKIDAKEAFLEYVRTHRSENTEKQYKTGFQAFERYLGKNANEILEQRRKGMESKDPMKLREFHDILEAFHKHLIEKEGKKANTARGIINAVVQFFSYWCVPIQGVSYSPEISKNTAIPEANDFRKMYALGDLREKLVLSLGLDLAWRVGDIITLTKEDIPDLEQECPIQIEKITAKEKEFSSTFISCETVQLLKAYIPTLRTDNDFLFQTRTNGSHVEDETLEGIIQDLGFKSGFCDEKGKVLNGRNKGKNFTWKSFRKAFLTVATSLGVESDQKCLLVGKGLEKKGLSMETYIGDPKLKNAFLAVRNALSLTKVQEVTAKNEEIEGLKATIVSLSQQVGNKDIEIKALREKITSLEFTQSVQHQKMINIEDDLAEIRTKLGIKEKMKVD